MGGMQFTISCFFILQMLHIKFGQDWPCSSSEDINRRRTTDAIQSNRSPEWLKIKMLNEHWLYSHVYCLLDTLSPSCKIPRWRPVTSEQYTPFYFSRWIEFSLFNRRWCYLRSPLRCWQWKETLWYAIRIRRKWQTLCRIWLQQQSRKTVEMEDEGM